MATKTSITRGAVLLTFMLALPLLCSCALIVILPDEQNVLVNGGFEEGAFVGNQNNVMSVLPGDETTISGWKVTGNAALKQDVVWLQNGNGFFITTTDGKRFLDLTGSLDTLANGQFGGVMQHFPTAIGFDYRVRFDVGVFGNFPGPVTVTVRWGTTPDDRNMVRTCGPFDAKSAAPWTTCDFRFRATSAETYLTIVGASGTHYIGLDKVSVDCYALLGNHNFCRNGPL